MALHQIRRKFRPVVGANEQSGLQGRGQANLARDEPDPFIEAS
jgi:hypothetical protein